MFFDEYRKHPVRSQSNGQKSIRRSDLGKSNASGIKSDLKKAKGMVARLQRQNAELEKQIKAIRSSKTMKLGRMATTPVRLFRQPKAELSQIKKWVKKNRPNPVIRARRIGDFTSGEANVKNLATGILGGLKQDNSVQIADRTVAQGEEKRSTKTGQELGEALSKAWYRENSISEAVSIVDELSERGVSIGDQKSATLVELVRGIGVLDRNGIEIPPRTNSPAYVVESGRVMYCVHSTPVFNSNGYSTRTKGVVEGLVANKKDVVVVARSGYPWDSKVDTKKPGQERYAVEQDGALYVHIPGGNLNREGLDRYVQQAADAFVREALLHRPQIIQAASNYRTALPALIAARRIGVPFVYEVRGLWEISAASNSPGFERSERFAFMRKLETLVAKEADRVFAITSQVAGELIARGVDPEKIIVAPNAVDPNRFLPYPKDIDFTSKHGIDTDKTIIGFAGSMVEYEGLDLLVKASGILGTAGIDHQIVLAGSGSVENKLKELARKTPGANVVFLGRLPHNQMPQLLSTFDVVACPRKSTLITELVSALKPLESFSSAIATVLSAVAPNQDLAGGESEKRALLVQPDDPEELARGLKLLIEDKNLRDNLAREARKWTISERSWAAVGETMARAYRELLVSAYRQRLPLRSKEKLIVGIIADEFTSKTLAGACTTVPLDRKDFRTQFAKNNFDLIFVESAWSGNAGQWQRAVGFYTEEESADLDSILEIASREEIPTIFWNKEDPVHFARFAPTAAKFDYVFTTDSNMIPKYMGLPCQRNIAVSSMPFFAQPCVHNPLVAARDFHPTIAYAGTYYGERYPERSQGLDQLLQVASKFGLDIYDRQANNPDSPYRFPEEYSAFVQGALPYDQVISSYATHIAHLNVNSVTDSPTMFSRRAVEIPACGGIVLSAPGRGIVESLGSNIPCSAQDKQLMEWLGFWSNKPALRLAEIWRQFRTIYRSHTTDSALAIAFRTAGFAVQGVSLPSYAVRTKKLTLAKAKVLIDQSVRPAEVVSNMITREAEDLLVSSGIQVKRPGDDISTVYETELPVKTIARTHFEDLLTSCRFGVWQSINPLDWHDYDGETSIIWRDDKLSGCSPSGSLVKRGESDGPALNVFLPPTEVETSKLLEDARSNVVPKGQDRVVLFAGHDLKFAEGLMRYLESKNYRVLVDNWTSHTDHDVEKSNRLLRESAVIFCEWGLGNAVWYSKHKLPGQRLIVRVHSQELRRPYLKQLNAENVDHFVFVGELVRRSAVLSHGIPLEKTLVVPNAVNVSELDRQKTKDSEFSIGMVGIVPKSKRFDLALDLLEKLLELDGRYKLRIKGKTPADYPWMKKRKEEMNYFDHQRARVKAINDRFPGAVIFDGYGSDMANWYSQVGVVISTSDFESFHLTLADGAASGAMPVSLAWPGADLIYPASWLHTSISEMTNAIAKKEFDPEEAKRFVRENFEDIRVYDELLEILLGSKPTA